MHLLKNLQISAVFLLLLAGCNTTKSAMEPVCGDATCSVEEDSRSCPSDCGHIPVGGNFFTTYIPSEGIGRVAVLVAYPTQTRFVEGAGVVVIIPPFLSRQKGFTTEPDFTSIGLIQVSFLWPGAVDNEFNQSSDGEYDYGGPVAIQALRDVLRFATGRLANVDNRLITTLLPANPLVDEVGIFSFSHAGIATTNVISQYGSELDGIEYLVGYENPTMDCLTTLEAGYMDNTGISWQNPFYQYPASYSQMEIKLNYGTIRWDGTFLGTSPTLAGRPYLDLDGNALYNNGDFPFNDEVPVVDGRRYYSTTLIQELLNTGALTQAEWPASLATVEQSTTFWSSRQSIDHYMDFVLQSPNLKIMLVFGDPDLAQAAVDKPHIHQAFQGFRFAAELRWVRLNPDRAYLQQATGFSDILFPDNPANSQPVDWSLISEWAFDTNTVTWQVASLAALAEMSDRAHTSRWDENIGATLFDYIPPTSTP